MTAPSLKQFIAESPLQRTPIAEAVTTKARSLEPNARVLDVGAGAAPYRDLFAHCVYTAQDWEHSVHDGYKSRIVADIHDLPIDESSFDFVLCTEVLEHVEDPAKVLAELNRVIAPGGQILITVPFVGELHEEPHDHWRFTNHGLRSLLTSSNFVEITITPLTGYWTTLAHILRHGALATQPLGKSVGLPEKTLGTGALLASRMLSRVANRLDRFDRRRALPIGWTASASVTTE